MRPLSCILSTALLWAVLPCGGQGPGPAAPLRSPEVQADRHITFRVQAPGAGAVRLVGGDIPGLGPGAALAKSGSGAWEVTVGPVPPGAYRYLFSIDGTQVVDPANPASSESLSNLWSLAIVPGSEAFDTRDVPHGALAEVAYRSSVLGRTRRMHVYTPPGYEAGTARYPIFYLLHGASDSDDSWSSVGRAACILDNLIASGKARPMVVVMPCGHTRSAITPGTGRPAPDEFEQEFMRDILPNAEKRYRILPGRQNRAIAGLSMGGAQTLNLVLLNPSHFAYAGVFSSGLFSAFPFRGPSAGAAATGEDSEWVKAHRARLTDARAKAGLKLLWMGIGRDDFLLQVSRSTEALLKKLKFNVEYQETEGSHAWLVWRDYLAGFAPRLFR